jgi:uncharacterized protein (DUF1810 family)
MPFHEPICGLHDLRNHDYRGFDAGAMTDEYNLKRFVEAQESVFEQVSAELRAGQKQSHWMWFIFPQLAGLGSSPMAERFGIVSREEAAAYLKHPVLGPRLRECTRLANLVEARSVDQIFGYPDNLKFHSSMTLFAAATLENQVFKDALQKYFGGKLDPQTKKRL